MMDVTVEIHCERCGSANISIPDAADDAALGCNDCGGRLGTLGELKHELFAQAMQHSAETLRKGLPGEA